MVFLTLFFSFLFSGCKKDPPKLPVKPILVSPYNNEACTTGTVLSATESSIVFTWAAAANTDSYDVTVKNLETGATQTKSSDQPKVEITLLANAPYSWFVVSKSKQSGATATSDVWKFYNTGTALTSYIPFPADIVSPAYAQTLNAGSGKVTLSWTGNDLDNDISGYDVYFGKTVTPELLKSNVMALTLTVDVSSNNTYYWKVVTVDKKGNKSDSGIYTFKIN